MSRYKVVCIELHYWIDEDQFTWLKNHLPGQCILITNRHDWSTEEIILIYWGQANVEGVFRMIKNPFYVPVRPQSQGTDEKLRVYGLICFIALLLSTVLQKRAREKANFDHSLFTLMEMLTKIRLATSIEKRPGQTKGRYQTRYLHKDMEPDAEK